MSNPQTFFRSNVSIQPSLRLVDLFEESTEYERNWRLPFNSLSLTLQDDPADPSWVELPEEKKRLIYQVGTIHFTTCDTPMRIRYTKANRHFCIHFRYELFPGVDLFNGIRKKYVLRNEELAKRLKTILEEKDPLRKIAGAQEILMDQILHFWPEKLPLDLTFVEQFSKLLQYVDTHLDSQLGIREMARFMGWSEAYFSRMFRSAFHVTPKQYLVRELFARALGLLNDPQKNIKEIAEKLKFSSEFNFSRFIRRYSGHPPSELRRKNLDPLYIKK